MKRKRLILWIGALALGLVLGAIKMHGVDVTMSFIATIFTRLFRLLAVPTIVLAVVNTLASLGSGREMNRMFGTTVKYTFFTTFAAAAVALGLYVLIAPGSLPAVAVEAENPMASQVAGFSYADHILSVIPENVVQPLLDGNVLALLLMSFAAGIALSKMPESASKRVLSNTLLGLQDLLFMLIGWLINILPLGIVAFSAQLMSQIGSGLMAESLGKYTLVIIVGNLVQMAVVLPLFLLGKGLNPIKCFRGMSAAVVMAFFTKSSAGTLPVTIDCAENRLKIPSRVARFVLPICTTVNMNGCAAFILVTSLFVMQNNGMPVTVVTMAVWLGISVLAAVGNAGVPMGCYFLTLSLMSGMGADIAVMGLILPVYTVIDMVETAENVWSDSSVCAITARTMERKNDTSVPI